MTTQVRVQHLDSVYAVEVVVMDKEYGSQSSIGVAALPKPDVEIQKIRLVEKGDETCVYIHSGRYIIVREVV